MAWEVEYTDEFETRWIGLDEEEQIDIAAGSRFIGGKGASSAIPL
jgi:hypothetical protein